MLSRAGYGWSRFHCAVAQVPLNAQIQQLSDAGTPVVVADPSSPAARVYVDLAARVAAKLRAADEAAEAEAALGPGAPPPLV